MRKIGSIFLAVVFLAGLSIASGFPRLVADDLLNASENRWLEMLREQISQVSESKQRMAISMTVGILAEVGRYTEAKTIAFQRTGDDAKSELLATIAASMAQKSLFEDAFSAVSEISEPGWKDRATHYVAMALAGVGELERAERLAQEMSEDYYKEQLDHKSI